VGGPLAWRWPEHASGHHGSVAEFVHDGIHGPRDFTVLFGFTRCVVLEEWELARVAPCNQATHTDPEEPGGDGSAYPKFAKECTS